MVRSLDRRTRDTAVTMRGSILGHNYNDLSERDIREGAYDYYLDNYSAGPAYGRSDVYQLTGRGPIYGDTTTQPPTPSQQNIVRILKPHVGELSQCWLDIDFTIAPADNNLTLKVAVGQIVDGISSAQTAYSDDYVDASWRKISGSDLPLAVVNGHLTGEMLNLLPALLQYGDDGWDQDMICLILQFNKVPAAFTSVNRLQTMNLTYAAQGVI